MKRWTMKQLKEVSDKDFILTTLRERQARCTNVYSPLYEYITELMERIEDQDRWPDSFAK